MSSESSSADKTEEPTPKRLQDARNKGDVARSRELDTAIGLGVGAAALALLGPGIAGRLEGLAARTWAFEPEALADARMVVPAFLDAVYASMWWLAPFLVLMLLAAFAGPALMGGFVLSAPKVDPKRLDPLKGIGRMFSAKSAGELAKSIAKVVLFAAAAWFVGAASMDKFMALGRMPLEAALGAAFALVFRLVAALAVVMALIAAADVPWQRLQHTKKLRMTKDEVKRERKENDGSPEVKSRMRSEQIRASQQRMLQDVPGASVVVTNPTHYAVALRYREGERAPVVVAKGTDELAARIRAIATESGVRSFEAPPLARALHRHTRVGEPVRAELWHAVAQVLAFVMQLDAAVARGRRAAAGGRPRRDWPIPPGASDLAVPPELDDGAAPR